MCVGFILGTHEWANACAGFLCGPKAEIVSGLNQTDGAQDTINIAFLGANTAVVFLTALPTLIGMGKNVGRDEIGWYIGGSVLIFFVALMINFMADWFFGIGGAGVGGAAGNAGTGGVTGGL